MTYDEQLNCTFEPRSTKFKKAANQKQEDEEKPGPLTYANRQG
jgi:hypothetical protein